MSNFTISRHIDAPVAKVWEVLADFGNIANWSPGIKRSALTSLGPVGEGTTRHCDFTPMGGVNERIDVYEPGARMKVHLFETFKMPVSEAVADFNLTRDGSGTELTLHVSYVPNAMGRIAKGTTDKQMRKGMGGLAADLAAEAERIAAGTEGNHVAS